MKTVLVLLLAAGVAFADDLDTLFNRFKASFIADTRTPTEAEARAQMTNLAADGTWPDIDLSLTEQVNWTPRNQLDRLSQLAKAYVTPGHALAGNAELAAKIALALDAYIKTDPKSTNWWYNEIGAQLSLGPLVFLLRDHLTAGEKIGTDSILARSWKSKQRTGENLVWISRITAWRGTLNHDEALVAAAVAAIAGTIVIAVGEGIQADFSFHQHGDQLYNGGYGNGYASDGASVAWDMRGTRFAFTAPQLDILTGYLLDGERWMIRGANFDHSVQGREITRAGGGSANGIGNAALDLAPLVPANAVALTAFAADIKAGTASSVSGDRWFWRSEYLAHHRPGGFISVRMASKRLQASEVVNNEGLLSQYLADGATFLYRTGKEYDAVFPVWDWCHVPGTTTAHASAPPAMKNPAPGVGDFAGGISDGTYGAAAFDYDKLGLSANKAWFFFDKEMIAMGEGITSADTAAVHTTVNQCLLNGPVQIATGSPNAPVVADYAPGSVLPASFQWILHDRIGYIIDPAQTQDVHIPHLDVAKVSGNWKRMNTSQSATNVDKDVFSLWIFHGPRPQGGRYLYTTLMDVGPEELKAYAKSPTVYVLSRNAQVMAVRHPASGVLEAVFFNPAPLNVESRYTVTPDSACMLMLREEAGRMVIGVSDPRHGTRDMILRLNAKLTGPGALWSESAKATTLTFTLPKGDSAGAAVFRTFATEGVAIRPGVVAQGLFLSALRNGKGTSALSVTYRIPTAGTVRLDILDPQGRILSSASPGRLSAGSHRWNSDRGKNGSTSLGSEPVFVRLEWEGRSLVVPVRSGND